MNAVIEEARRLSRDPLTQKEHLSRILDFYESHPNGLVHGATGAFGIPAPLPSRHTQQLYALSRIIQELREHMLAGGFPAICTLLRSNPDLLPLIWHEQMRGWLANNMISLLDLLPTPEELCETTK